MIAVTHLVKRYGARLAVDDVSFEVGKGEVVGFLGPNGAGKSTTLRILAGFLGMTSGKVSVCGHDVEEDSLAARANLGYMPEAVPLYPEMRVAEYLAFRAELKGVPRKRRRANVDAAMEKSNVADVANVVVGKLSKGYRQRVGLADALVANPPLLILDEPTAGLDPNQIREVRDVIKELGAEHTVLLSTHILSEVEASCSRVILIAKGKLRAEGPTADIRRMRRATGVAVTVRGKAKDATAAVARVEGVDRVEVERTGAGAQPADVCTLHANWSRKLEADAVDLAVERVVAALVGAGLHVRVVTPLGGSLEDVFADLTDDARPRAPRASRALSDAASAAASAAAADSADSDLPDAADSDSPDSSAGDVDADEDDSDDEDQP